MTVCSDTSASEIPADDVSPKHSHGVSNVSKSKMVMVAEGGPKMMANVIRTDSFKSDTASVYDKWDGLDESLDKKLGIMDSKCMK